MNELYQLKLTSVDNNTFTVNTKYYSKALNLYIHVLFKKIYPFTSQNTCIFAYLIKIKISALCALNEIIILKNQYNALLIYLYYNHIDFSLYHLFY